MVSRIDDEAVEISTASLQATSGDWLATTHVQALLANGAPDEAERAIQELIRSQTWIDYAQTKLAAARGDAGLLWPPPDTITFPLKDW